MNKLIAVILAVSGALMFSGSINASAPTYTAPEPTEIISIEPYFPLTEEERTIVECIVMGESGGEPYEGQMLVAQCLLNACLKDGLQPSEVRTRYKYSGWNENPTESVQEAVRAVFDDGEIITNEPVLFFYAPRWCNSTWHETQIFVCEVGGHRFFKAR